MDFDLPPHYGEGLNRNEPIMIGSSDDEEDNIQHRRTRRLGGPQGTPIPRRAPERGLRIFSPPPPNPPVPFGVLRALPLFDEIGLDQHELMRLLLDRPIVPRVFAPIARSRPPEPEPEPYDVRMTHASARPRLGFTFDFEQPEEEEKAAPPRARVRVPVKFKQTIEIPDSPPPESIMDHKGKGKAKAEDVEPEDLMLPDARHKEVIEIYSDDEDMGASSIASSSQPTLAPATKLTSVLICAGCRRPLRTGGDRLWALRCGHMIDSRCYNSLSRPQFSSLPLLARLGSPPPGPAHKRRKTTKAGKGKGKGVMESHEWECPVRDCNRVHRSERMAGEEEWVPAKDMAGAIVISKPPYSTPVIASTGDDQGHTKGVSSVAYSPDGKSIVSGSWDKTIRIWDTQSPSSIGEPLTGHSDNINSVSYSPLGNIIASGSDDDTIRLWDINAHRQLGQPIKDDHQFRSVTFSPDARLIASGSGDYFPSDLSRFSVQLWDVQNMTAAANPFKGHTGAIYSVQFSHDGTRVVSGSYDKTIRIWDVERGITIVGPLKEHTSGVLSTAFSPDGSQMVSSSHDYTLWLWDAREGRLIGNLYKGYTDMVFSVAFSPCGTYVASGGTDNTVRVWDIRTDRQVQSFEEHTSWVHSVAFSPCGQYIASGAADHKVIIRNISLEYPHSTSSPGSQTITSQMSTQQMFDCLTGSGCVDLSSQMDTQQNTAMIVSGGGFGDIWMGKLHTGGKVAIKAWRTNTLEQCDYKTLKRAARELFFWSQMKHPNVHRLQGVIMFRDQYLGMVSEWMDNGNLHEYLRKQPGADRYQLCVHVASGLQYMHSRNTVHGDLKALNVLVSSDGVAKLSDFDFSIMSEASTLVFSESSNSRLGSLRWTAPEMFLEEAPKRTKQSDVYALGMTMLEIFTGEVPYPNYRQDFLVLMAVQKGTLPTRPLEQLQDDEQGNVIWRLLLGCWSRAVSERPSSTEVLDTLVSLADNA